MNKLGIIAASGGLAKELIEHATTKEDAFIVALQGEADPKIINKLDHIWIKLGEIGKAIDAMRKAGVKRIVFVGSLHKPDILSVKVDWLGAKLLTKIIKNKLFGDNKLLSSLTNFLEEEGFELVGVHEILKYLVVKAGIFTKLKPNKQDKADIELGRQVILNLGALDIGQGAIVENSMVLGVEAIEGTDKLIKRCAELKRNKTGGILVKFAKPGQELRIDLPTIGINTIKNLHKAGFKGIVIEANKTIFLDQEKVIEYADKHNMFIGAM